MCHASFASILESVQEVSVRNSRIGWLNTTSGQELRQIILFKIET